MANLFNASNALRLVCRAMVLVAALWQVNASAQTPALTLNTTSTEEWLYPVKLNESYARIQQQYLTQYSDIATIAKLNHHPVEKKLQPNQVLRIPLSLLKKQEKPVEVILVVGDVSVSSAPKNNSQKLTKQQKHSEKKSNQSLIVPQVGQQPLMANSQLNQGDTLKTGVNSIAKLRFADASTTVIQPNTRVNIEESFQYAGQGDFVTKLKLTEGRTEVLANPNRNTNSRFQIETPSAVAAVRGTSFRVGAEQNIALQETLAGEVAFTASGEEVLLSKGFGSAAEAGKAPLPPIVLPEAPLVTEFADTVDTLPVTFALRPQAGAVAWVSQLALDADFTKIISEQVVKASSADQMSLLDLTDLADGQYYLRLRAKEVNGLQGNDAIHPFKVAARPLPPTLIAPENDARIGELPVDLSWTLVEGGNSYLVQIAEDAAFTKIVLARVTSFGQLQINPIVLTTLANASDTGAKTTYFWRVTSLQNGLPTKFSKARAFVR